MCAEPLVVGMQLQYPPFEMISPEGKPEGISVDLAYALGRYLERDVKIENLPFVALIPALKTNKIDCIISSMTVTPERQQSIDFSIPYVQTGLCLLISVKSDMTGIADADRKGRVIVVKQGTSGELYALNHFKFAKVISLSDEAASVLEVVQAKADAFIYDKFAVNKQWRKNPQTTRAVLTPFKKEDWAIGLRKEDPLKEKVNAFLKSFLASGQMREWMQKYESS